MSSPNYKQHQVKINRTIVFNAEIVTDITIWNSELKDTNNTMNNMNPSKTKMWMNSDAREV
jgi:hypothetical protein